MYWETCSCHRTKRAVWRHFTPIPTLKLNVWHVVQLQSEIVMVHFGSRLIGPSKLANVEGRKKKKNSHRGLSWDLALFLSVKWLFLIRVLLNIAKFYLPSMYPGKVFSFSRHLLAVCPVTVLRFTLVLMRWLIDQSVS